jgi:hypothetical protein
MPLLGLRAFVAGVAVGWAGRSVAGSTREALVRVVVLGHEVRRDLRRAVVERWEWIEDLMAEGRIRYEESVRHAPLDDVAVEDGVPSSRGRAA